ncbi:NAD kinase [Geminicoccus harenae]|uniref:NAD kinase n=1 Tax=Geminicoccus harenae TaxID=2498453 RepID=UPI00168AAF77|nr:NAD kinase [Geminicoccus harenae]
MARPALPKLALVAAATPEAEAALEVLARRWPTVDLDEAEIVVALGGDGFMLETLHGQMQRGVPIYGMNLGTVGFLLNAFDIDDLAERLAGAREVVLHPLRMEAMAADGTRVSGMAINEVSIYRETRQAARLAVEIDGVVRLPELVCDGVLVATPAGSTAYNLSAHGPILPLGANLLAVTPISPFRPRRWRGALLPNEARFTIRVLDPIKRPASAVADYTEVRDVQTVEIWEDRSIELRLLFDPEHHLEERILKEQFVP